MNPQDWRRAEELFHAAVVLPPEARRAFLDDSCSGETDLRQRVESLLANELAAASFLEKPAAPDSAVSGQEFAPIGVELGSFQITGRLGAGGMGEVYRAHDRKLDRDVAIKILPSEFARDPTRLGRFRREARTLASLNHPNIAAIYDLEESNGVDCLVLELVEGETLADAIQRGPLPVATALDYARQVAEALEAAHEKGVVHRDLKPANVKVTPEGRVKVLDFGLAKAASVAESDRPALASQAATATSLKTLAGQIVGTPGYTSPEQARGQEVDQRTDIWALGCLLYEMLAGRRAFRGDGLAETIAAVLEREPDWLPLPERTPSRIRDLLKQCLQKDAAHRPQHMREVRRTIEDAQRGWNRWRLAAAVAATLAIIAVAGIFLARGSSARSDPSRWEQLTRFPDSVGQPTLSPDGRMVAFIRGPAATFVGPGQIYVKTLPDGEPVQLTHDETSKMHPVFSPDGTRVAYTSYLDRDFSWDTWVVPVLRGEPEKWLKNASGLSWIGPRRLLFSEINMGLHMGIVAADENRIGRQDVYMPAAEPSMAHRSYLSPDRKWVLLVEMDEDHKWEPCRVVPADGSSRGRNVGPPRGGCTSAAWSPDGKWIYLTSNAIGANHIWRQRFPGGEPEQITSGPTEETGVAFSPDGRSFITAVALQNSSLWIHDAGGERQIDVEGNAAQPKFTRDGKKLLYRIVREPPSEFNFYRDFGELRVVDLDSGRSRPIAQGFQASNYDVSADGRQVVMETADRDGKPQLWLAPLDGSSPPHQIPNVQGGAPRFMPSGEILFRRVEGSGTFGSNGFVYRIRPDGADMRKLFDQPVLAIVNVSPDGAWLIVWALLPGSGPPAYQALPLRGGSPVSIGSAVQLGWSLDNGSVIVSSAFGSVIPEGRTYLVPLPPGEGLPRIPAGGFHSEQEIATQAGARRLDVGTVLPGPSQNIYVFYRGTIQRNLYRVPIS